MDNVIPQPDQILKHIHSCWVYELCVGNQPTVGADLSRPPPIYRPVQAFSQQASTTTVVMKVHETLDERVSGARVVGNGCDVPRTASSFGISTRPAAPQANGPVTAAQSPTSGAPPAPATPQAHRLRNFFSRLPELDARQPRMSHHRERDVPIPAVAEAHFVLIEAGLPFG